MKGRRHCRVQLELAAKTWLADIAHAITMEWTVSIYPEFLGGIAARRTDVWEGIPKIFYFDWWNPGIIYLVPTPMSNSHGES